MNTPILYLIFNRPELTQKVFFQIRKQKPKTLFIAADGPRLNNQNDYACCQKARNIVNQIDWNCELKTLFRENNLGCKIAVSSAINWFFENVEQGIILEDDCMPDTSFFSFCEMMLKKYSNNTDVGMITGTNYLGSMVNMKESYYFSKYFPIWGWATWRNVWELYDVDISKKSYDSIKEELGSFYKDKKIVKYLMSMLINVKNGQLSTWDIQWVYTCIQYHKLCIVPKYNLISNIGLIGTHTSNTKKGYSQEIPIKSIDNKNMVHPPIVKHNKKLEKLIYKKVCQRRYSLIHVFSYILDILNRNSFQDKRGNYHTP